MLSIALSQRKNNRNQERTQLMSAFSMNGPCASRLLTLVGVFLAAMPARAQMPEAGGWKVLEEAHEIVNIATVSTHPEQALATYKSAGTLEIPDDFGRPTRLPSPTSRTPHGTCNSMNRGSSPRREPRWAQRPM
jgi:hypothetical protein